MRSAGPSTDPAPRLRFWPRGYYPYRWFSQPLLVPLDKTDDEIHAIQEIMREVPVILIRRPIALYRRF